MSGRNTLKTYFLTGATPTEANFADLIDSTLILSEDLTDSLSSNSSSLALTASAGKSLNDLIVSLTSRVVTLEGADNTFASNYYTKTEVDASIAGINTSINNLPYSSQISSIDSRVTVLESTTYASVSHSHAMGDITGLTDALNLKATISYVDSIESSLAASIASLNLGTDSSSDISNLQGQITSINSTIAGLPTTSQLNAKADSGHTHAVADITDIDSLYYDKTETDTLLSNVEPKDHTHLEADITDLDKYTTGAVDLKLSDHGNLTNNPHSVTKDQVGLGNVENLSSVSLFNSSAAQSAFASSVAHEGSVSNPHSVTKAQVGLSNVPDIDVKALLDAHEAASNPHNINLSFFDVYSRAETDTRVQHYIDTLRYAYTPSSPTDSSGSVGDFAYDSSNLYFKAGATNWLTLSGGGGGSSGGAITGTSLNIGSGLFNVTSGASASTDINTPNLTVADQLVLLNKNQTGTPLTTLEGGLEIERGNYQNAKIYWQESSSKWKCNLGGQIKTITFDEDINPLTSTTDLQSSVIAAPSSWGSNKPVAYFSYTVVGGMVTVQWYLDGSNTNEPLTALNNDQIYYPLPSAIAFNRENAEHVIRVPMSVRTGMTATNATAFGDAFVEILNNTTRIGMRFWGINNVTSLNYWSASGQVTYPI